MSSRPFESDATRPPGRAETVAAALASWRRQLSSLGGPNTLLWFVEPPSGVLDLTTAHPGGVSMLLAGRPTRLSDLVRERGAFSEARSRAAEIRGRALALRSARGLETSFLTAGMATWEHPGAPTPPHAPVLLRSCTLRPSDPVASDFDVSLGDEVELNPVLAQYLRSTAHIDLDIGSLAEMSTVNNGFDPYPVYAALARLCEGLPGFTVTPRVLVSTFPHGKLAMVGDLAELAEPASVERLAGHAVIAALATQTEGEAPSEPGPGVEATEGSGAEPADPIPLEPATDLDPDPDPTGERLVLDADVAQSAVVDAVLRGQDVMVQAPPGTGTTQTIANVVAALAGQRNSTLLVAEQRSEIEDVRRRLDTVGLGSLVADVADSLFDHRGTLAQVVSLVDTPGIDESWADRLPLGGKLESRLRAEQDALRDHVTALHEVRQPWGVTVHETQCAISELGYRTPPPASRVRIRGATLARLSKERLHELAEELTAAAAVGAWTSGEAGDPWYGARITTDDEVARASSIVRRLADGFDAKAATLDAILTESSLPAARTAQDWKIAVTTMSGVRETLEVFRPEIFDVPLDEHVAATGTKGYRAAHGVELGWWARSRVRRLATRLLRPGPPPEDLHAELVRARTQRTAWYALVGAGGRPEISPQLDEAQDAYDEIDADLTWLGQRLASTTAGGELHTTPLDELRTRLRALAARPERLAVLPAVVPVIDDLRAAGMGEVVDDFAARGVEADEVTAELEHIWWLSIARHVADSDRRYGRHDGTALREAAERYTADDREHLAATARRTRVEAAAWHTAASDSNRAAAAMLRAEADRAGRPASLRTAFEPSADLLVGAAPCWAMSPLVVGEALPPGAWFDVVVVVGAGALTSAASVSALARGRQVVAFGDSETTWPTGFTAGPGVVNEAEVAPRSLLEDLSRVLPVHRLTWAHGYADARLLRLAGGGYADGLVGPPSPIFDPPVTLELVDGRATLEPGDDATIDSTDAEVDRVVSLVLDHARRRRDETLAAVTLTERHAQRIREALATTVGTIDAAAEPEVLAFLDAEVPRPVAVVSIDAAAGLARDAVVLSVGYGKTRHGRVLHRFPALSSPDASRQLRAALTSARRRVTVVSSIAADQLDESRLRDAGSSLRDLLLVATDRSLLSTSAEAMAAPDPLMTELASRLRREGLVVAERIGSGPHRVDLALAAADSAERWLVAVDGDGPEYATWRGTRDRDRLWPQALERQGWRHVRVWSTDLYRDPAPEVARIVTAVREQARALGTPIADEPDELMPAPPDEPEQSVADVESMAETVAPSEPERRAADSKSKRPAAHSGRERRAAASRSKASPARLEQTGDPNAEGEPVAARAEAERPVDSEAERPVDSEAEVLVAAAESGPRASGPPGHEAGGSNGSAEPAGSLPRAGRRRRRAVRRGTTETADPAAQTTDDTDAGWGEHRDNGAHEQWLQDQRPPHWD